MKKVTLLVLSALVMISLTQCNSQSSADICSDSSTRGKIISELMSNDAYMKEVMDSMKTKHSHEMMSSSCEMMKNDKAMGVEMMGNMMDMCKSDTSMCKMMMGKTMDMCDMDESKCTMMKGCMEEHPKGMESMKNMGMCNMKGMDSKKDEHSEHHKK